MKNMLFGLIAMVGLLLGASAQVQPGSPQSVKPATLHIAQETMVEGIVKCSATVIGPHAILTASHCEAPSDKLYIEGIDDALHIEKIERDDKDHSIYLLSGPAFKTIVPVDEYYSPKVGEKVFMFGNPGAWSSVYREGYVAGSIKQGDTTATLVDINAWHGDSGSGIFDSAGKLISVDTGRVAQGDEASDQITFAFFFPLRFTQEQLVEAEQYGTMK